MANAAAFFDLDRTLLRGSSSPIFAECLAAEGVAEQPNVPLAGLFLRLYEEVGENPLAMVAARQAVKAAAGWPVDDVARAAKAAAARIADELQPFAHLVFEHHRNQGDLLVIASTSPQPLISAIAHALGFDAAIGTEWEHADGKYLGTIDGDFVWGTDKAAAVRAWASDNGVRLSRSTAYSDSYYDSPMLDMVGTAVAVNPDPQLTATAMIKGWEIRHLDKNPGVAKVAGRELQDWGRPFMRPEIVAPYADISLEGVDQIPADGGAILVFNHRSYFDPTVLGLIAARAGRPVRGLGKKEVFDVPVVGRLMKAIGGIRVERASGSDEPLDQAEEALRGGELIMMAPQGTIPRGPAFFDPELQGRWGAAKLAARTRVPVIPIGLWGTEKVWPRSARLPNMVPRSRPKVQAVVGAPVELAYDDLDADTRRIMTAIMDLLPAEAHERREPTEAELAATYPPGYTGDPTAEANRRPGTDTASTDSETSSTANATSSKEAR